MRRALARKLAPLEKTTFRVSHRPCSSSTSPAPRPFNPCSSGSARSTAKLRFQTDSLSRCSSLRTSPTCLTRALTRVRCRGDLPIPRASSAAAPPSPASTPRHAGQVLRRARLCRVRGCASSAAVIAEPHLRVPPPPPSRRWFETSAKTNHNIEESVRALVSNIMTHQASRRRWRQGVSWISRRAIAAPPCPSRSSSRNAQGAFEAQRISAVAAAGVPGKVALDKEVPPEAPAAKSGCC